MKFKTENGDQFFVLADRFLALASGLLTLFFIMVFKSKQALATYFDVLVFSFIYSGGSLWNKTGIL